MWIQQIFGGIGSHILMQLPYNNRILYKFGQRIELCRENYSGFIMGLQRKRVLR